MLEITLRELLNKVYKGEIVLPDFQRSFVWYPEDVRELLVSVLGDYFIGSILWLEEIMRDETPFALRLIEGVEKVNPHAGVQSVVKVILDGQQRITSLFYAFYQPNMKLRDSKHPHKFYLDIEKALNGEWDDAVISVSTFYKNKIRELDNSQNIVSLVDLLDVGKIAMKYGSDPRLPEIVDLVDRVVNKYKIHAVPLPRDTDLEKIVETFERINRTGLPLSVFDLLTAKLYNNEIKLGDLLAEAKQKFNVVKDIKPEIILKTIVLIRGYEPKRANILKLSHKNFEKDWWTACEMLELAYRRVTDVKNGYGVLDFDNWMPYTTMLVPMAAMIHFLKTNGLDTSENYEKIDRWYWTSVFSQRYDQAVDTKAFKDLKDFKEWVKSGKVPEIIEKFNPSEVDLDVESMSSAIHKGVLCLIVLAGALDFQTGQSPQFEIEKVQIDHVFPKSIFRDNRVLVKTIISTNQKKLAKKPSKYFGELVSAKGAEKVKEILKTHLIPEEALDCLLNDNLNCFVKKRRDTIIEEIKRRVIVESIGRELA